MCGSNQLVEDVCMYMYNDNTVICELFIKTIILL